MKKLGGAVAMLVILLGMFAFAQTRLEKGGGDVTGPYEVVAGWPQNWCGTRLCYRIDSGNLGRIPGSRDRLLSWLPS